MTSPSGNNEIGLLFSKFLTEYFFSIVIVAFAALIIWRGLNIMSGQISQKGLGRYNMQGLGIFILAPIIMILGAHKSLGPEVLSALIGSLVGYVFGANQKE
mgnify:CR=1 FL=1|jgi:phosphotransferase system  glucose/maltose/N-acetylglucosamine-specific IIC component|tara:strand:+ start:242 stop:544 length:303 start_codon:yes stop_codon:yes gene_type:complete